MLVKDNPTAAIFNKLAGVMIFVWWLVYSRKTYWSVVFTLYLLFIFYASIIPLFKDVNMEASFLILKTMIQILFLMFFLYNIYITDFSYTRMSLVLLVASLISYFGTYLGLVDMPVESEFNERIKGITSNSNTLALMLTYGLISFIYLMNRFKFKYHNVIMYTGILFFIYSTNTTGSRKTFLALIAILIFHFYNKLKTKRFIIVSIAIVGMFFVFSIQLDEIFQETLLGKRFFGDDNLELSTQHRGYLYQQAFTVFLNNPIVGIGLGNLRFFTATNQVAHSYYMELLSTTGLIGLAIIVPIYKIIFSKIMDVYRNIKAFKNEARYGLMFLILFFIISFGFHMFNSIHHWIVIAILISFIDKIKIISDHEE